MKFLEEQKKPVWETQKKSEYNSRIASRANDWHSWKETFCFCVLAFHCLPILFIFPFPSLNSCIYSFFFFGCYFVSGFGMTPIYSYAHWNWCKSNTQIDEMRWVFGITKIVFVNKNYCKQTHTHTHVYYKNIVHCRLSK